MDVYRVFPKIRVPLGRLEASAQMLRLSEVSVIAIQHDPTMTPTFVILITEFMTLTAKLLTLIKKCDSYIERVILITN